MAKSKKSKTDKILDNPLYIQIIEELNEDLSRYDEDYESWSEIALDCPSNTLEELLDQIPESDQKEWMVLIEQHIRSLGE